VAGLTDTIAAIATPPGRGGVAVLRLSGPDARRIATEVTGRDLPPRRAVLCRFRDAAGEVLDHGLALHFAAPASFTGEDVVELQGHGSPVVCDLLLARVLQLGARLAQPGEFSLRAFLNDRLDLVQAEAIADLVASRSEQAARAALRSLDGDFSRRVRALVAELTRLRVWVEAAIDFPEEEIDFLADPPLRDGLAALQQRFDSLAASLRQGRLLLEGLTVVIAGPPNAGKSSLLNALAGAERAIVTHLPGTTRDVIREHILIDGMPLNVLDTAGLRDSDDLVEQEGVRRTHGALAGADHALLVVDGSAVTAGEIEGLRAQLPAALTHTLVINKTDLPPAPAARQVEGLRVSALTGEGLDGLRAALRSAAGLGEDATTTVLARRRHLDALARARRHLDEGIGQLEQQRAGELLAEELRLAQQALGEITGTVSSDDLLGEIFSSFCIGK
jgi:tRNA modification GTPase